MTPREAGKPGGTAGGSAAALDAIFGVIREGMDEVDRNVRSWSSSPNPLIAEAGSYLFQDRGKRLRPALVLLSAKMSGYEGPEAPFLAALIEVIHTASLIHDDIIDNAGTRRGKPSVHSLWGPNITVLLGDYLFIKSIGLSLRAEDPEIIRILADLSARMIEGELVEYSCSGDVEITESRYFEIIDMKTASLFTAAARIGGRLGKQPPGEESALADIGKNLGMAFQIVDDLLDIDGDAGAIGKPVLSDLTEGRITLPLIHALNDGAGGKAGSLARMVGRKDLDADAQNEVLAILGRSGSLGYARAKADEYADGARALIGRFPDSSGRTALLRFADYVMERER